MKLYERKFLPYLIVVATLFFVFGMSYFMRDYYHHKAELYAQKADIELHKKQSKLWVQQFMTLLQEREKKIEPAIQKELYTKVNAMYELTNIMYSNSKSKKEILNLIEASEEIFLTDYDGNPILYGSQLMSEEEFGNYFDEDNRSIILEEIQKVKHYGDGFLHSKISKQKGSEIIYVKSLGFYNWFIGSSISVQRKQQEAQEEVVKLLQAMPLRDDDVVGVFQSQKCVYLSKDSVPLQSQNLNTEHFCEDTLPGYSCYIEYFKPFNWYVLYGFKNKPLKL